MYNFSINPQPCSILPFQACVSFLGIRAYFKSTWLPFCEFNALQSAFFCLLLLSPCSDKRTRGSFEELLTSIDSRRVPGWDRAGRQAAEKAEPPATAGGEEMENSHHPLCHQHAIVLFLFCFRLAAQTAIHWQNNVCCFRNTNGIFALRGFKIYLFHFVDFIFNFLVSLNVKYSVETYSKCHPNDLSKPSN